jgi:hypothetical protein
MENKKENWCWKEGKWEVEVVEQTIVVRKYNNGAARDERHICMKFVWKDVKVITTHLYIYIYIYIS